MKITSIILALFFLVNTNSIESDLPNYVVIFCDDLGYGDLSSFGNPTITTPNLDRMAMEGQKWTQFYVADPVCTPSRAGLMTGRYPIRSGMTSSKRGVLFPDSAGGLPSSEITIAEILKERDYKSAAIGKWHLGHLPEYLPRQHGFDYYYGIPYSNDMDAKAGIWNEYRELVNDPDYAWDVENYNVPLIENEKQIERPTDQTTITRRYTDKAIEFIEKNQDGQFFVYLAHSMPHIPLFTSPEATGVSKRGKYGDVIQEIDHSVGRVLESLKKLKLDQNTVVVFTSDNGPWLSFKTHGGSAGPLRAGKGTTFEGGQRVPTIFWGPGIVKPGMVTEMGSTMDLLATFASLSNIDMPNDRKMDSYDLSEVLKKKGESPRKEFFYWVRAELYAARIGNWKLHIKQKQEVNYSQVVNLEKPELYHLEKDISEKYDRAESYPEVVENILTHMENHKEDTKDRKPDQLARRLEKAEK